MAIKNFNQYSSNQAFGEQINLVTEELVQRIRERMDYYQPMVETDEQLDIQYQGLINRIVKMKSSHSFLTTLGFYLLTIKLPIVWLRSWRPMPLSTLVVERFL